MVVEGSTLAVVCMTDTQLNRLTIFFVNTVLTCDRIAAGSVFRTVKGYAVDGNRHFTESRCALVVTVGFGAVGRIVSSRGIVKRGGAGWSIRSFVHGCSRWLVCRPVWTQNRDQAVRWSRW